MRFYSSQKSSESWVESLRKQAGLRGVHIPMRMGAANTGKHVDLEKASL